MANTPPEFANLVKKRTIMALFSDDELMERLVLKGGNLLDIVYNISSRASLDVDFSVDGDLGNLELLKKRIENTLKLSFNEINYEVFDVNIRDVPTNLSADMESFWGGYKVDFKIIDLIRYQQFRGNIEQLRRNAASIGKRGSTKFEIDISKHEYCDPKQATELESLKIYVYTPLMLTCEKLRAICQQMPEYVQIVNNHPSARARDFIDIHAVVERYELDFGTKEMHQMLSKMFDAKRVPLHFLGHILDYRDYHRQDYAAVKATTQAGFSLREFDFYFDFVVSYVNHLKPLWSV
jgi:hypothetical protein